ncbi:hypothetical protein KKF60_02060 [Patescibacteria group bacterium]|nr:hypothetical protein [Patescibacteria group bacterium]MBU4458653.1 hypothetical protein [Patescibacteria group bacterium]MCG2696012.1 hypothetical protein [Candidatus Portnoybacteria bacterium]
MFIFTFGSIRVSFRMVVKFFKGDGKLFSQPCEKWIGKEGKQFTLFNGVKIEHNNKLFRQNQFTKFAVTDESGKVLDAQYPHEPDVWRFETMKRIKVRLWSNGTSAEFLTEYFLDEKRGIYRLRVTNPDKNARLIKKSTPKPASEKLSQQTKTAPAIDPKTANEIANLQVDPFRKHEGSNGHVNGRQNHNRGNGRRHRELYQ